MYEPINSNPQALGHTLLKGKCLMFGSSALLSLEEINTDNVQFNGFNGVFAVALVHPVVHYRSITTKSITF